MNCRAAMLTKSFQRPKPTFQSQRKKDKTPRYRHKTRNQNRKCGNISCDLEVTNLIHSRWERICTVGQKSNIIISRKGVTILSPIIRFKQTPLIYNRTRAQRTLSVPTRESDCLKESTTVENSVQTLTFLIPGAVRQSQPSVANAVDLVNTCLQNLWNFVGVGVPAWRKDRDQYPTVRYAGLVHAWGWPYLIPQGSDLDLSRPRPKYRW